MKAWLWQLRKIVVTNVKKMYLKCILRYLFDDGQVRISVGPLIKSKLNVARYETVVLPIKKNIV